MRIIGFILGGVFLIIARVILFLYGIYDFFTGDPAQTAEEI